MLGIAFQVQHRLLVNDNFKLYDVCDHRSVSLSRIGDFAESFRVIFLPSGAE